ncbi:MAG: DUF3185 family protein [Wenzhouxiangellaceae bacterium]
MGSNKLIGLVLLVVGIILLYFGYQSSQGLDDQISEAFTGNFTDSTLWYYLLGGVASVAGLVFLVRK